MTEQEVNKILAEFEGLTPNPHDGGKTFGINSQIMDNELYADFWITPQYTTDWNDFHRVWTKFNEMGLLNKQIIFDILQQPTPSLASHKLADVVKQHTTTRKIK